MKAIVVITAIGLTLALFFLPACDAEVRQSSVPTDTHEEVILPTPEPGGVTYADLSENFEITIYPAYIKMDGSDKRLFYKIYFMNKTESEFNNFKATCVLSPEMQLYIASGIVFFGDLDIGPRTKRPLKSTQGVALDTGSASLIRDDAQLREWGLDPSRLAEFASTVTLELTWNGGLEVVSLEVEVIDETV